MFNKKNITVFIIIFVLMSMFHKFNLPDTYFKEIAINSFIVALFLTLLFSLIVNIIFAIKVFFYKPKQ